MKRCPKCRRDYNDDSLSFCLDDGSELLFGPASMDEPQTAILPDGAASGEPRTQILDPSVAKAPLPSDAQSAPSIAVLPFVNMSADGENEYFCDGLAEEMLNALTKINGLKVAARTSAFAFKGKNTDISEIAEKLGVKTILEGSVRKSADRVRITTQLINAADGYHLWSERYDRELKDIFDVQDEIAVAVVDALKIKLLGEEKAALLKRHTQSPEAHEFYLRGLSHFAKWTPADFHKAIENFGKAIAIDPEYASAYAGVADSYTELSFFSFSPIDATALAKDAATRALQLDPDLAEAHNSDALIKLYFDWDYPAAEAAFKKAIALNPGSAIVHMWYGWYLGLMARFDESLRELRRAHELDPLSPPNNNAIGVVLLWSGQTDVAIEQFKDVLELVPGYPVSNTFLAEAYAAKGDMASAIATIESTPPEAMDPQALGTMGYVYARSGNRDKAQKILDEFAERSSGEYIPALNFAQIYSGLDARDQAFECIVKACEEGAIWIPFLKVDLKFDHLRSDPRFKEMLQLAGFC
ncbi:MAG: tetratricopeptide repeat protein [Pyrinomonadaceae bacterium]